MKPSLLGSTLASVLATFTLTFAGCADDSSSPDEEMMAPGDEPVDEAPVVKAGDVDTAFGENGIKTLGVGYGAGIATQGDKLIACVTEVDGMAHAARLYQFDADGTLDTSFGIEGRVTLPDYGEGASCRDIEVGPSRLAIVVLRGSTEKYTYYYTLDGEYLGTGFGTGMNRITSVDANLWATATVYGTGASAYVQSIVGSHGGASFTYSTQLEALDTTRAFRSVDGQTTIISRFGMASSSLRIQRTKDGQLFEVPSTRVQIGNAEPELLSDAIRLPDNSLFAVGGYDSGSESLAVRWVFDATVGEAFTEHHPVGGAAFALGVTLDTGDHPIVVGRGTGVDDGTTVFFWQRYNESSSTLDSSYQTNGIATLVAPSGSGELNDVAELNGALYAIGTYATETTAPKIALIKIAE